MLTDYQWFALRQVWPVLVMLPPVAVLYYVAGRRGDRLRRSLAASPPLLLLLAYAYALGVAPRAGDLGAGDRIGPFWFLLALFVVAEGYCLARFNGNGWTHALQLLLVPGAVLVWILGTMTINQRWL